jgi:hypothetical protein
MDVSLHEQRALARIDQELSDDRRLAALATILGSERPTRWRRLRIFRARLRHPRQDNAGNHRFDIRPLLAVTHFLTVACVAVLVTSVVLDIVTLIVVSCAVLPMLPALGLIAYVRLRRGRR